MTALRDVLAILYPTDDDVRRIADEAASSNPASEVHRRAIGHLAQSAARSVSSEKDARHHRRGLLQHDHENNRALADAAAAYLAKHPD